MFQSLSRSAVYVLIFLVSLLGAGDTGAAPPIETAARHAILIEMETGAVLFEKDADTPIPPASMSKLMTIYEVFAQLKSGALKLDDTFTVGVDTWRKWRKLDGSTMFLNAGDKVTVEQLLRGIIVQSGNDACDVIAIGLAGSIETFADWLNQRAAQIGLTDSHFTNPSGWPDPDHRMSVRDIAKLSERLIREFPEYYHYFAEKSYTYAGVRQPNRNPLLFTMEGADGLKTGHTEASGYGLAASAQREGRRLVLVFSGTSSMRERAREAERLMSYGFRNFKTYKLFDAGEVIDNAVVWLGDKETVPLVVEQDVKLTLARTDRRDMTVRLVYDAPLPAPIEKGQPVAVLEVSAPDMETVQIPVVAGDSSTKLTGFKRVKAAFNFLLWGASGLN
ncbi:MAG: D-alanyl-D-alanine carboxypeptidase [Alphaproteobacteria bacterium]|nr:MAG: D-alanyl-D-alanine carboxypeptidase [Alphaproteobacteria bacterium]